MPSRLWPLARNHEREKIATAQSVFQPRSKSEAVPQIAQTDLVTPDPIEQTAITKEAISSKPRKLRAVKGSLKGTIGAFGFMANIPDSLPEGAASNIDPSAGRQEPPPPVATENAQGVAASKPGDEAPLKAGSLQSDQRRFGHNPVWGPGQRWKRRLRHLRLASICSNAPPGAPYAGLLHIAGTDPASARDKQAELDIPIPDRKGAASLTGRLQPYFGRVTSN